MSLEEGFIETHRGRSSAEDGGRNGGDASKKPKPRVAGNHWKQLEKPGMVPLSEPPGQTDLEDTQISGP